MKKRNYFITNAASQIRPLRAVAFVAAPCEVGWMVDAEMLLGNDMFDVERQIGIIVLVHLTILTAIAGAPANQAANGGSH
jgi:hypothetical protein